MEKRWHDAMITIEAMAESNSVAFNSVPARAYYEFHTQLERNHEEENDLRLLRLLNTIYKPSKPFEDIEAFRLDYARRLYDDGDKSAAGAVVNAIQSSWGLEAISTDPDFRALQNPKIDLLLAAERQYAEDEITLSEHRDSLEGVIVVASDLRRLGRYQDALAKLESVRDRMRDPTNFADFAGQQIWWWDGLAQTYLAMGDYDHAAENFRIAIGLKENGKPNVSQVMNLAMQQMRFGHYPEALATLAAEPDDPEARSVYGTFVFHYEHGCAAKLAGHDKDAADDVAYLIAHEKESPGTAASLFLCLGDMDRAASLLILSLADPDQRSEALSLLSDYRSAGPGIPETPAVRRLAELKKRPDIKTAIAKAGGIPSFPFRRDDL